MNIELQIGSLMGIIPAIIVLYFIWGKFEGFFKDKLLFFHFVLGIVLGAIIGVVYLILIFIEGYNIETSILILVILFALFTEMLKFIILNRPKYHNAYDTTYYGFAMGLGMGAMWISTLMTRKLTENPAAMSDPYTYIFYLCLSFSGIMIHSSTGAILGYGIANFKRKWAITFSLTIQAIFNIILLLILTFADFEGIGVIVTVIYSFLILYHIVYNDLLINTLPQNLRKKLIRKVVKDE